MFSGYQEQREPTVIRKQWNPCRFHILSQTTILCIMPLQRHELHPDYKNRQERSVKILHNQPRHESKHYNHLVGVVSCRVEKRPSLTIPFIGLGVLTPKLVPLSLCCISTLSHCQEKNSMMKVDTKMREVHTPITKLKKKKLKCKLSQKLNWGRFHYTFTNDQAYFHPTRETS